MGVVPCPQLCAELCVPLLFASHVQAFYGLADIVCPNETELSLLTGGMPVATTQEVEAAARTLQNKGPSFCCI